MGELTASLAHEISQPISGAITNANVCLRKLGSDKPDLDEVRVAVTRISIDAQRATETATLEAFIAMSPLDSFWLAFVAQPRNCGFEREGVLILGEDGA
jgi:signal transduction histidine kinase